MSKSTLFLYALCCAALLLFFHFIPPGTLVNTTRCAVYEYRDGARPSDEFLLPCSNKEQRLEKNTLTNLSVHPAEEDGWQTLSTINKNEPGSVCVLVKKRPLDSTFIFYPRISGPGDLVLVKEDRHFPTRLFSLRKEDAGWTPIGAQYTLNASCLECGLMTNTPQLVRLRITLFGKWAQLWIKDGVVFF